MNPSESSYAGSLMQIPNPLDKPLLSVAETAVFMHEGEYAVRRAIELGQIPSIRIGRYVRIPTAGLLQILGISDA